MEVRSQPGQIVLQTLSLKTQQKKTAGGMNQVLEHLPSKHEALSLNCSTAKKKRILQLFKMSHICRFLTTQG
jgi:hypothetical protein